MAVWSIFNLFFLLASLPLNIVFIGILLTVETVFTLFTASCFLAADGTLEQAKNVKIAAGAFGFASGMLGYYTVGNLMCKQALGFGIPMGDTSQLFRKMKE
jgi:uncharacterized protein